MSTANTAPAITIMITTPSTMNSIGLGCAGVAGISWVAACGAAATAARFDESCSPGSRGGAKAALALYRSMLRRVGVDAEAPLPYNLLVTREWMLLVPRSREFFGTISVNALGFAGGLLVRNGEEMKRVRDAGPMEVLRSVGVSR